MPPPLAPALAGAGGVAVPVAAPAQIRRRRLAALVALALVLGLAAATASVLASGGTARLERLLGMTQPAPVAAPALAAQATLPVLRPYSAPAASGSDVDVAHYTSAALSGEGTFYVYLPPGYGSATARYPVLYLLHGTDQPATAFLEAGLQADLDSLIAARQVPPMVVVMIQGGPGKNNWRDAGSQRYESYILEVQGLVDRMLATEPVRSARAVAGDSMGGYGSMNVSLDHPYTFAIAESWMGFFTGFGADLARDRAVFGALGFHAFLYGAESDHITDPWANAPFAAELRHARASAESAIYPGEHNLGTVEAHLEAMLTYAGHLFAKLKSEHRA